MSRPINGILASQKYPFYLLFVLKFPGMSNDTPKLLLILWEFISWVSVFVPFHMAFCFFKTVYDGFEVETMDTLSNIAIQGMWLFCSFITMLNYKLNSENLIDIIDGIENQFQWRSAQGRTFVDIERIHKYARIVALFWQILTASSVVGSLLRPLFMRPVELPTPIWYPINMNNPYQFALVYFVLSWAQIIVVCSFAVGSTFFFSFGLLCLGQFNIIRCALKNLIFTSGLYKKFPEVLNIHDMADSAEYLFATEVEDSPSLSSKVPVSDNRLEVVHKSTSSKAPQCLRSEEIRSFRVALKNCVKHQLKLLRLCTKMEEFWNFFALLRVLEVTLQMCFMAFVYVRTSDIFVLLFGVLAGMDLFLLTYPAEYIREQNNLIGTSLMTSPWYLVSEYFRNDFLIILTFAQRPIQFTAGKIMPLNADRLRQAITTAFSYYTLLSSFDQG